MVLFVLCTIVVERRYKSSLVLTKSVAVHIGKLVLGGSALIVVLGVLNMKCIGSIGMVVMLFKLTLGVESCFVFVQGIRELGGSRVLLFVGVFVICI